MYFDRNKVYSFFVFCSQETQHRLFVVGIPVKALMSCGEKINFVVQFIMLRINMRVYLAGNVLERG